MNAFRNNGMCMLKMFRRELIRTAGFTRFKISNAFVNYFNTKRVFNIINREISHIFIKGIEKILFSFTVRSRIIIDCAKLISECIGYTEIIIQTISRNFFIYGF